MKRISSLLMIIFGILIWFVRMNCGSNTYSPSSDTDNGWIEVTLDNRTLRGEHAFCTVMPNDGFYSLENDGGGDEGVYISFFSEKLNLKGVESGSDLVGRILPIAGSGVLDGIIIVTNDRDFGFGSQTGAIKIDSFDDGLLKGTVSGTFIKISIQDNRRMGTYDITGSFEVPVSIEK
ncbi:hypothetical protein JW823_06070 [bacterium]|nr:hypothetical protein [candidate division CSSED10-310 bacterium]